MAAQSFSTFMRGFWLKTGEGYMENTFDIKTSKILIYF